MAFGCFNEGVKNTSDHQPMSEINVTPMVDVMLVLLVIFIITAPLFTHAIKLDLPQAQAAAAPEKPDTIALSINAQGKVFWNNAEIPGNELNARLAAAGQKKPQPELHLRADRETRYETIAQVMSAAQGHGLTKIGFVTEPKDASAPK